MVVHVQHAPLRSQTHTPRSTSTNTNRYTTCCAVDMRTGGGGRGSHAVRQAPHPHNIEMHQLPTKKMVVDVQHAPLCPHTLRSTPRNTNKYTSCCAVDTTAGGGGHGTHAVRKPYLPHNIDKKKKHTTAHQKLSCHRTACAPVPTHAPLHLDKYKHIHTLLRCRYGDGRRRARVT